jgi:hypothetical protein
MKKMTMFLTIGATVALLALPVAAQDECTPEKKTAMYTEFGKIYKTDQPKAAELAKKYLACPAPAEITPDEQKIIDYLKKWSTAYEEGSKKNNFLLYLYGDGKTAKPDYPKAYGLGKELVAKEPENVKVLVHLGANGYLIANNPALSAEALDYARKALQLIESGKAPDDWQPLAGKDAAVAYLNFTVGALTLEKDPTNALKNLMKAAQFETPLKKSPFTYAYIAGAYETGAYAKQSEEYKIYLDKPETPESKLALANINQIVERMIDGYARAVALAGNDPAFAKQKPDWQERLTSWYKYMHNKSDAGMTEYVAAILSKPLPPEPTPLTSLPASTPASTPIGNSGTGTPANGTPGTTTPAGTSQAATKPATTPASATTKPAAGAKPGTTPDRPRNNHRH